MKHDKTLERALLHSRLRRSEIESRHGREGLVADLLARFAEQAIEDAARCFRYAIELRDPWWVGCGEGWVTDRLGVDDVVQRRAQTLASLIMDVLESEP